MIRNGKAVEFVRVITFVVQRSHLSFKGCVVSSRGGDGGPFGWRIIGIKIRPAVGERDHISQVCDRCG